MMAERVYKTTEKARENARKFNTIRRADPEYRKAEIKSNIARVQKYRTSLLDMFGNKCNCKGAKCWHEGECAVTYKHVLQLEHINGNGELDRRKHKGNVQMTIYYAKHPEEARKALQLYCSNCNWAKRFNMMEHNQYIHSDRESK